MRLLSQVILLLGLAACGAPNLGMNPDAGGGGGSGGSGGGGNQRTAPPPASQLPDGGTTASGAPATDEERLRTQLQWFATSVRDCTTTVDTVHHGYATAHMAVLGASADIYSLRFTLGGAAATDTYFFPIDLVNRPELSIKIDGTTTTYQYASPYVYFESLRLTTFAGGGASLMTFNNNGRVAIYCNAH